MLLASGYTDTLKGWEHELDTPREECGIIGLYTPEYESTRLAYFGLFALQHRGQESAGIATSDGAQIRMHRDLGLVNQVFNSEEILQRLPGHISVGHNRYSTTGRNVLRNAQPIYCQSLISDVAVGHNGNLINAVELREELEAEGIIFQGTNDSEVIARLIVKYLGDGIESAVRQTMAKIKGAYSVVVLLRDKVVGFRDPNGVRPMIVGTVGKKGSMIASESCAFGPIDGVIVRDVEPGEAVILDERGLTFFQAAEPARAAKCMFEFIYFARPDSTMYGTTLYTARERMGEQLALEERAEGGVVNADIVVPVPDSGIPAAQGFSRISGIPFKEGMMKSRYIHRTFIQPDQRMREMGVRMKLSPLRDHIRGKRVVLVDDSIVRATTTNQIVKMLFDCGAAEVHVRITAPPIMHPCFYGVDMASRKELAAAKWSIEEIRDRIGATSLRYLSISGAATAVGREPDNFCLACFNGDYPIPVPEELSKEAFE